MQRKPIGNWGPVTAGGGGGGPLPYGFGKQPLRGEFHDLMKGSFGTPTRERAFRPTPGRTRVPRVRGGLQWANLVRGQVDPFADAEWYTDTDRAPAIAGFTLQCTTQATNCIDYFWRFDGYHAGYLGLDVFGCNNLAYACNNWGPPEPDWEVVRSGPPVQDIAVSMEQGPFTQWLRFIYQSNTWPASTQPTTIRFPALPMLAPPFGKPDPVPGAGKQPGFSTAPRSSAGKLPQPKRYQSTGTETEFKPRTKTKPMREREKPEKPTRVNHLPNRKGDEKWIINSPALYRLYGALTEIGDFVECVNKNAWHRPPKVLRPKSWSDELFAAALLIYGEGVDYEGVFACMLKNNSSDFAIGKLNRMAREALTRNPYYRRPVGPGSGPLGDTRWNFRF